MLRAAMGREVEHGLAQVFAQSEIHVDLMIGSPELQVDGITDGGEAVPILRSGAWQI